MLAARVGRSLTAAATFRVAPSVLCVAKRNHGVGMVAEDGWPHGGTWFTMDDMAVPTYAWKDGYGRLQRQQNWVLFSGLACLVVSFIVAGMANSLAFGADTGGVLTCYREKTNDFYFNCMKDIQNVPEFVPAPKKDK